MNRPARKHLYSLPRMTKAERASCLIWEVLTLAVVIASAVLIVELTA